MRPQRPQERRKALGTNSEGLTLGQAVRHATILGIWRGGDADLLSDLCDPAAIYLYVQTPRIGISAESAAFGQSALFAIGVGGKYLAGWLSDKLKAVNVMVGFAALMFAASLVLARSHSLERASVSAAIRDRLRRHVGHAPAARVRTFWPPRDREDPRSDHSYRGHRGVDRRSDHWPMADRNGGDYTVAFYGVTIAAALAALSVVPSAVNPPRQHPPHKTVILSR